MFSFVNKEKLEKEVKEGSEQKEEVGKFSLTNRHLITAPRGKSLVSVDFKNQEFIGRACLL